MEMLINILFTVAAAVAAITLHEYVKALVSHKLGDPVPRAHGRLTLNPARHFDPLGLLCMVLTGYGWGKPVQTSPSYYKDRKKGTMLTYITPSVVNLIVGTVFATAALFAITAGGVMAYEEGLAAGPGASAGGGAAAMAMYAAERLLSALATANVSLAVFNIIPIYPLDGAKILSLFLKPEQQVKYMSYEKILQIILLAVMFTGGVRMILSPIQSVFMLGFMSAAFAW